MFVKGIILTIFKNMFFIPEASDKAFRSSSYETFIRQTALNHVIR